MVKLDLITNKNDECYTPTYAVEPIIKYLNKDWVIWCPFDNENSYFVKILKKKGFKVIFSHIENDKDFFKYEPNNWDCIISNPPYSLKGQVIKRCFKLNKPFALLVGVVGLFESQYRFDLFKNNDFEIMYFNKRVAFFNSFEEEKPKLNPPFSSVYLCSKLLPKKIIFEELNKKNINHLEEELKRKEIDLK